MNTRDQAQRYGMVDRTWYEESWQEMGECSYGDYVLYSDYMALLDDKAPERQASTKDLADMINAKIGKLEKTCDRVFLEKDEMNYGYAVAQRNQANILRQAAHILNIELY
jgi:hypothetical protein